MKISCKQNFTINTIAKRLWCFYIRIMNFRRIKKIFFWSSRKDEYWHAMFIRNQRLSVNKIKKDIKEFNSKTSISDVAFKWLYGESNYRCQHSQVIINDYICHYLDNEEIKKLNYNFDDLNVRKCHLFYSLTQDIHGFSYITDLKPKDFIELWNDFEKAPFWKFYNIWLKKEEIKQDF